MRHPAAEWISILAINEVEIDTDTRAKVMTKLCSKMWFKSKKRTRSYTACKIEHQQTTQSCDRIDHSHTERSPEAEKNKKNFKWISAPENRTPSEAITSAMFLEYSTSATIINSDNESPCNPLTVLNEMLHIVYTHVSHRKKWTSLWLPLLFLPILSFLYCIPLEYSETLNRIRYASYFSTVTLALLTIGF